MTNAPDDGWASRRFRFDQLAHEEAHVWLLDPEPIPYLRQTLVPLFNRAGRPRIDLPGTLVGYATLRPGTRSNPPGIFERRIFWLKPYDRHLDREGIYSAGGPMEMVDPASLAPGLPGRITARALGRA